MTPSRRSTLRAALATAALRSSRAGPLALLAGAASAPRADEVPAPEKQPVNAGPYVPSPDTVVSRMLDLAEVGPSDVLIDMGSGDGRIVLTAVKLRGARGLGIEIDEKLVARSIEAARRDGIADRARFVRQDLFATDVSAATVVTIYLLPATVNMLDPKLRRELRPGTRVIVHDYPLAGWLPEAWKTFEEPEKRNATGVPSATVYLYRVPAAVGGPWFATVPPAVSRQRVTFALRQQWQMMDGMATVGGREVPLEDTVLRGDRVTFRLPLERGRSADFEGRAKDGALAGTVRVDGTALPWHAAPTR